MVCIESEGQNKKFPPDSIQNLHISSFFENSALHQFSGHFLKDTSVFVKTHNDGHPAVVYLDSILVVDMPFIDVYAIKNIRIEKGFDSIFLRNGKIYLTSKKESKINLWTVDDIKKKYSLNANNNQIIWMVNDDFIERTQYFKIDSSYLYKIQVQELPIVDSFNQNSSSLTIIRIFTKTAENIAKFSELRVRGLTTKR